MLRIPETQQETFAAAMKHYLENHEKPTYSFFVVAAAQEDHEAIICLCGYPDREKAYIADKVSPDAARSLVGRHCSSSC